VGSDSPLYSVALGQKKMIWLKRGLAEDDDAMLANPEMAITVGVVADDRRMTIF
jgi:agmatine/peptidylarginine deiminase